MKLLFDENLSPRLPELVANLYPNSVHVRDCGLKGFPDDDLWDYADRHGFIIVSKDSDFYQRSLLYGHPPKLVWLRIGNCTRADLVRLLTIHQKNIHAFDTDPLESVLVIS
jgi:predicted nuclease of predicted toxin-antitoxin system